MDIVLMPEKGDRTVPFRGILAPESSAIAVARQLSSGNLSRAEGPSGPLARLAYLPAGPGYQPAPTWYGRHRHPDNSPAQRRGRDLGVIYYEK